MPPARGFLTRLALYTFQVQASSIDVLDDAVMQLSPDPFPVGCEDLRLFHLCKTTVGLCSKHLQGTDDKVSYRQTTQGAKDGNRHLYPLSQQTIVQQVGRKDRCGRYDQTTNKRID